MTAEASAPNRTEAPPADTAPLAAGFGGWWVVFVLFLFYLMSYVDRTIIAHLVDPMKASLHLGDFEMGLLLGPAFAFAYSLAMLPAGWVVDRFDRRTVVGGAMIFWSLMTIACGLASSIFWLVAARMMIAVGEAVLTPAAYALIGDHVPRRQLTTGLAFYNTGAKAGTSVAFFVAAGAIAAAGVLRDGSALGGRFESWQIVFFLVGVPGLLFGLLPLTFRASPAREAPVRSTPQADPLGALTFVRRNLRILLPLLVGITFVATANGAMSSWLPTHMQRAYGWNATQYGPPIGAMLAVAALLTVAQGYLVDRLYARGMRDAPIRYLSWMLAVATPVVAVAFTLKGPWPFLACIGVLQAIVLPYALYLGSIIQLISPPAMRGRMTSIMVSLIPIFSQGLGPLLIGALTDFVFHDPKKLGMALGLVMTAGIFLGFVMLRISLKRLHTLLPATP
ncbi:MAG: permease of the major facilitator superfamily [Phenylobacterium sp.]|nr:permease of the major facilitator superfamily [Phenylobacterium sp.]